MSTAFRFFLDTLSRIGSSIFAGSLVSCLVLGRTEPLHIGLMLAGATLTGLGYPIIRESPQTAAQADIHQQQERLEVV